MKIREALNIALLCMRTAPLRSALTALGIVIGVAAVVVLVALGTGVRNGFDASFASLGTFIQVSKVDAAVPGGNATKPLTEADMEALAEPGAAPDIAGVLPFRNGRGVLRYGEREYKAGLAGTDEDYLAARNRVVEYGRMFTPQENQDRVRVIVIGPRVADYLFMGDRAAAIDKEIRVNRLTMRVIGVMKSAGENQDDLNITPLNSSRALYGGAENLNGIGVVARSTSQVLQADAQIKQILDERRGITDPKDRDYNTAPLLIELERIRGFLEVLSLVTIGIAAVSLLVGGLGVANIMLVTVTERTSEIGIRKAVGAKRSAVMEQFLIEAMLLSTFGGLVGIGLGIVLAQVGGRVLREMVPQIGNPVISLPAILIALGVSLVIGFLAGGYPAYRAARMHPIQALRL